MMPVLPYILTVEVHDAALVSTTVVKDLLRNVTNNFNFHSIKVSQGERAQ